MIDLSVLMEPGKKFCVRCRDEESTVRFLNEMFRQYPERCKYWKIDENKWLKQTYGFVDYYPYFDDPTGHLYWDENSDYPCEHGFTIIDFYDLPGANGYLSDFGEIESAVPDISLLF